MAHILLFVVSLVYQADNFAKEFTKIRKFEQNLAFKLPYFA